MNKTGTLVIVSGFSGAGKGTVTRALIDKYGYSLSISATTRKPREGEQEGVHYFFKTEEEFLALIDQNGLVEYAKYVDHYYGTPRAFVESELEKGNVILLEIEVQGAMKIKEQYPDAILLFITTPSAIELKDRLTGRGTESDEIIEKRLKRAREEVDSMELYDYIVCNKFNKLEECIEEIHAIIQSASNKTSAQKNLIDELMKELKGQDC